MNEYERQLARLDSNIAAIADIARDFKRMAKSSLNTVDIALGVHPEKLRRPETRPWPHVECANKYYEKD